MLAIPGSYRPALAISRLKANNELIKSLHNQLREKDAEVAHAQSEMKDQAAVMDDLDKAMRDVAAVSASSRATHITASSRHTSDGDSCILRRHEAWLATAYHNDRGLDGDSIWSTAAAS